MTTGTQLRPWGKQTSIDKLYAIVMLEEKKSVSCAVLPLGVLSMRIYNDRSYFSLSADAL